MRFLAALAVVLCHLWVEVALDGSGHVPAPAYFGGWVGVGFFFVLSGFVLAWSARPHDTVIGFWRRRLVKIYPNHLVTWAAALILALVVGQRATVERTVPSLFLLHGFWPDLDVVTSINVPSWSLSCELAFYLAFPLLHRAVARIRGRWLGWFVGAIAVAVVGAAVFAQTLLGLGTSMADLSMTEAQNWFTYAFPPVRTLDFLLGIVLARMVREERLPRLPLPAAVGGLAVGVVAQSALFPTVFAMVAPMVLPVAAVIVAGAWADVNDVRSPLSRPLAVKLGEVSFALYLVHFPVFHFGHVLLGQGGMAWPVRGIVVGTAMFVASLGLAWLLHHYVEQPAMRRWGRSTSASRRRSAPVDEG
ncbi:acyltransferase family protein [Saccharothrix obliqua]|uniref:acyltransferase family protein n=1 Tax=Saccharothrix obliqua TaxID=2861747 RepID=UPI001C5E89C1|nr:acyltransferase [Saccharothrix obliqua]MBW4717858.1 acyltransferase [Saccharothrix obliqua]